MSYPTEAWIIHRAKLWEQPSFFTTLKEIRSLPEIHEADRKPKPRIL